MTFQKACESVRDVLLRPFETLHARQRASESVNEMIVGYAAPLSAISALCLSLLLWLSGDAGSPVNAIFSGVVVFAATVGCLYGVGMLVEFMAPRFGGRIGRREAFALTVYSATPAFFAGFPLLLPEGVYLAIAFLAYAVFIFYQAVPAYTGITGERQNMFSVSIVGGVVAVVTVVQTII